MKNSASAETFESLLAGAVREDPGRPLVTFYDDATGERVELSVVTYANWVSKTVNLVADEFDLARGDQVVLDLPTHWLGAVWLGAVLTLGLRVINDPNAADLIVCGPERLQSPGTLPAGIPVLALSLRPLGARFATELPAGVTDYGAVVLGQPDAHFVSDPPGPADPTFVVTGETQQELLAACADLGTTGRILTELNPVTRQGAATLLGPLQNETGCVWVINPAPDSWERRGAQEHATTL
ncbi:MAG: TIGR03089 family protein [Nocardioidaceae bacterium]|nr:MAG: TIGR03089 family protein [Nocardioidaceae bacterium]